MENLNSGKQPFLIHRADERLFAFAGLWERWRNPEGEPIESCTIITTEANDLMRPIHPRMPVILRPADFDRWLDPQGKAEEELLRPYPDSDLVATAVSTRVNNARNDDPECAAPFDASKPEPGMLF